MSWTVDNPGPPEDVERLIEESTAALVIAFRRWCRRQGVEPPTVDEYREILAEAARLSQPDNPGPHSGYPKEAVA